MENMRTCTKCLLAKPVTEYFIRDKNTGRLHAQCKSCYCVQRKITYSQHYKKYRDHYLKRARLRRTALRQEFHQNMLMYLADKACTICSEKDLRVLELDHLDPGMKRFDISQAVRLGYSWPDVLVELKKCQVLCANCHKKRTAEQYKWYKNE